MMTIVSGRASRGHVEKKRETIWGGGGLAVFYIKWLVTEKYVWPSEN